MNRNGEGEKKKRHTKKIFSTPEQLKDFSHQRPSQCEFLKNEVALLHIISWTCQRALPGSQDQFDLHVHVDGLHKEVGDDEVDKNEAHGHDGHRSQEIILRRWRVGQNDHEEDEGENDDREEGIVDAEEY